MTDAPKRRGRPFGSKNKTIRTDRRTDHLFKPGNVANPAGRPKGSRNKFSETLISSFCAHFEQHGASAIEAVYSESPVDYLRLAVSIVPKQFGIEEGTQDVFLQVWRAISEGRA